MEKTLLIVDDNKDIIEVVQELIGNLFDHVVTATSVETAQQKLLENAFSFIILDINLQKRNGAEVIKFLQDNSTRNNEKCHIVILSGIINESFTQKHKEKFAGIIMKPFENDNFVQTIKNILNKNIEINNENIPIPDCTLPFPVPQLQQKVNAVMDQIKKNSKLKALFNNLIVNRNSDNFLMEHIGMLINISTGISIKMEWDTDKTLEKFVYASYLHDIALAERPDLARIHATAIELELMKDNMNSRDYQLLFEHPNLAAKTIDSINEIPQDVGTMVKQHHELPRENGYPAKLSFGKITPLSTVFIVSHDLLHYIVKNPKWTMKEYLAGAKIKFKGPHFAKVIYALSEIA